MKIPKTPKESYRYLKLWQKQDSLHKLRQDQKHYPELYKKLYSKITKLYKSLPTRKNGENPLVHPLNVVLAVRQAHISNEITLVTALLHDYVEEVVDLYEKTHKISKSKEDIKKINNFQKTIFEILEKEILSGTTKKNTVVIINAIKLLTRNKQDNYYQTMQALFSHKDKKEREIALKVKLADRTHNILSLQNFEERGRLYQCYKNLFILNNTKKYLLETYGKTELFANPTRNDIVLLYKRCAKATYEAFLQVCSLCMQKGIKDVKPMLLLALKKFSLERQGMWEVTRYNPKKMHLMGIFHGIIHKYDARLHRDKRRFDDAQKRDISFLKEFFSEFSFSKTQIYAIVDYKDAYALREVLTYLLYLKDYVISGFLVTQLTKKGRIGR